MRANLQSQLTQKQETLADREQELNALKARYTDRGGKILYYKVEETYFTRLNQQLRDTMTLLEEAGTPYTLLPYGVSGAAGDQTAPTGLLQEDVDRIFAGVRSPDGDF